MADIVRNPAFTAEDVARVKDQRLADIAQEKADPFGLATRAMRPIIYGENHPYGNVGGLGNEAVIEALTPDALRAEHQRWLRAGHRQDHGGRRHHDEGTAAPARKDLRQLAGRPFGAAGQGPLGPAAGGEAAAAS